MNESNFRLPTTWPRPADMGAADRLVERFQDLGRAEAKLAQGSARTLLRSLGGNSPFLAELVLREPGAFRDLLKSGPDKVVAAVLAELATIAPTMARPQLSTALRRAKRIIALATAIADIGGMWSLERVTETLCDFAEAALQRAVAHLLRAGHDAGHLRLPYPATPERACGFTLRRLGAQRDHSGQRQVVAGLLEPRRVAVERAVERIAGDQHAVEIGRVLAATQLDEEIRDTLGEREIVGARRTRREQRRGRVVRPPRTILVELGGAQQQSRALLRVGRAC